jgi:hypothetical protein
MAAYPWGQTGTLGNPLSSQENLAVNEGQGGSKDSWFQDRKHIYKDPTRLLLMRQRRDNPFWHVIMSYFGKQKVTDLWFEWDEQEYVPTKWTVAATADATSGRNIIKLSTTDVKYVQENDLLSINGIFTVKTTTGVLWHTNNTDAENITTAEGAAVQTMHLPETVKVIARDLVTGWVTVERAYNMGNPAGADVGLFKKDATYVATGMVVLFSSPISSEMSGSRSGFRRNPERLQGAVQIMLSDSWYQGKIEKNINYTTGQPINKQRKEARTKFFKGIDRLFLHGGRLGSKTVTNADGSSSMETMTTSILENIPNSNYINFNDIISLKTMNNKLKTVFDVGSKTKFAFTTRTIIYELYHAFEQKVVINDKISWDLGVPVWEWKTPDGKTLNIMEDPEMENFAAYNNAMLIVDLGEDIGIDSTNKDPYLQYMFLQNCDVQVLDVPANSNKLLIESMQMLFAVCGLKVAFKQSHFMMYNFLSRS